MQITCINAHISIWQIQNINLLLSVQISEIWSFFFFFGRLKVVPVFPQYKVRKQLSNDHAAFMGEGNQPVQ